jgi:hypothetical protein
MQEERIAAFAGFAADAAGGALPAPAVVLQAGMAEVAAFAGLLSEA